MNGEIFFNMTEDDHPITGSSPFMLKRWRRFDIYAKSGSHNRTTYVKSGSYGWKDGCLYESQSWVIHTNNPVGGATYLREDSPINSDLYQSCSVYLYDYVVVSEDFYSSLIYTASIVDSTPSHYTEWISAENGWGHTESTFRNFPNTRTNNMVLTYDAYKTITYGYSYYAEPYVFVDNGTYFEVVKGYPRNHYTHKRGFFSLSQTRTLGMVDGVETTGSYRRNRQTIATTIGQDGLEDGSSPIQATQVGNLNLIQSDNVINK